MERVKYLSPEDLAERYGVEIKTVYTWNSTGTGPRYMRVGKHARYKPTDVEAWEKTRYADASGAA